MLIFVLLGVLVLGVVAYALYNEFLSEEAQPKNYDEILAILKLNEDKTVIEVSGVPYPLNNLVFSERHFYGNDGTIMSRQVSFTLTRRSDNIVLFSRLVPEGDIPESLGSIFKFGIKNTHQVDERVENVLRNKIDTLLSTNGLDNSTLIRFEKLEELSDLHVARKVKGAVIIDKKEGVVHVLDELKEMTDIPLDQSELIVGPEVSSPPIKHACRLALGSENIPVTLTKEEIGKVSGLMGANRVRLAKEIQT